MNQRVSQVLIGLGLLGLLVAASLILITPIVKMSGPNAFASIEEKYVDFERVRRDSESREQYELLKSWIMNNEPALRDTLRISQTVGIAFALFVSVCCFCLAIYLRPGGPWWASA